MKVRDLLKDRTEYIPNPKAPAFLPVVSIFLPTYCRNKNGFLKRAVDSVLNQSFSKFELIIIDDGSTDGTTDYIKDIMHKDGRVSCIRHKQNIGLPSISEYEAFMISTGQYIAFMFDDNEWEIQALEKQVSFCESKGKKAVYGKIKVVSEKEEIVIGDPSVDISTLRFKNIIANSAVLLHRDVICDIGLFDPHISLIRNCDYDLWLRIIEKYEFVATDVFVGCEYGPTLSDSLGNSYSMDCWAWREYIRKNRNYQLTPENFGDYDPFVVPTGSSEFFTMCMQEYAAEHLSKPWYVEDIMKAIKMARSNCSSVRRVAVMTMDISASLVSFYRLAPESRMVVHFFPMMQPFDLELAMADVIIISRNLDMALDAIQAAVNMGTPLYYFVDDCFTELNGREDIYIKRTAALTNREFLSVFTGVILSTQELLNYYRDLSLHDNLFLLEPAMPEIIEGRIMATETELPARLNVAFFGGMFRENILVDCVIPALKKLSLRIPITFHCPDDPKLRDQLQPEGAFEVHFIKRTICLEQALIAYRECNIDIQVHCGEHNPNNRFKTINALMNSVLLNSVLVASNVEPYNKGNTGVYLIAENTVDGWYDAISKVLHTSFRLGMFDAAKRYCYERFNAVRNSTSLEKELFSKPGNSMYVIQKKCAALYAILLSKRLAEPVGILYYTHKVREYLKAYGLMGLLMAAKRALNLLIRRKR